MNSFMGKGFVCSRCSVVIVGLTRRGETCVVFGGSVEELQADWDGERKLFPEDIETVLFVSVDGQSVKRGRPVLSAKERIEDVIPNMQVNTKVSYLYRDGCYYTSWNTAVVKGVISKAQADEIISCLRDGKYFIPEQVGLPANRMHGCTFDPQFDTPYFELSRCRLTLTGIPADTDMTVNELTEAFRDAKGRWDEGIDISW